MEGVSIDHQNFELLIANAEFVPPARCADRGPESGKPSTEDQDSLHVAALRDRECKVLTRQGSLPMGRPKGKIPGPDPVTGHAVALPSLAMNMRRRIQLLCLRPIVITGATLPQTAASGCTSLCAPRSRNRGVARRTCHSYWRRSSPPISSKSKANRNASREPMRQTEARSRSKSETRPADRPRPRRRG
jgi:hypothetical protein